MAERQIKFGISFDVNKSGLDSLAQQLQDIQNMSVQSMQAINQGLSFQEAETQLDEVKESANEVYQALQRSFNADLGTVNITKFNQELNKLDLNKIYTQFSSIGTAGQNAFRTLTAQVLSTNTELQRSKTILDSMAETMGNTVKWGIASSAMNKLTGSVQEAYGYVKNLDTSLNNIRIVTEKSAEDMAAFAESANTAAKALGSSTTDYTNAALIYYQQGLSDEEVQARTEATIKTANVTGQSAEEVSEQLTAVWNGYQVTTENAESSIDILAAVAANSAANLEELSTGMAKVASSANAMGVSEEELTAQLATIISVTQQAPESVGTALRTIYARLSTISSGGVDDEDGATLTSYTKKMANFGISVLDVNGHLRDMGDVITEVGEKWDDFSREQQISLAQTMAGTRQYNYVLALFENWDQYNDNLLVAENSLGTLQGQQDIYMESTTAHLEQLNAAWEDVFDSLLSGSDINALVDIMTNLVNGVADFVDAIGGGRTMLVALGSTALTVFSTQIGRGLQTMISNMRVANEEAQQLAAARNIATQFSSAVGMSSEDQGTKEVIQQAQDLYGINVKLTQEQEKQINNLLQEKASLENTKSDWNDQVNFAQQYVNALKMSENPGVDMATDRETGVLHLDFSSAEEYSGILSELDEGLNVLQSELEQTADVSITKLTDSADKASEAVKNLHNNSSNYKTKVEELKNTLFDNTKTIEEVTKAEKELAEIRDKSSSENVKNQIQAILDAADAYQKEKKAQDELKESSSKVLNSLRPQSQEYIKLKAALEEEKTVEGDATKSDAEREKALNNLKNAYHQGVDAVQQYKEQVEGTLNQNYQGYFNNIVDGLNREKQAFDQLKTAFSDQALYTSLTQFVGGLGQVASGILTIQGLGSIIDNNDLSVLEKTAQITVNLSMGFGQLVNGVMRASSTFKDFANLLKTSVIPAVTNLVRSLSSIQSVLIVAAIAAIVAAIYNIVKSSRSASIELETLTDRVKDLQTVVENCTTALNDFKDAISNYDDAIEAFGELEKGVEGYSEALQEANDYAKELIETYQLFSNYHYDENGLIVFDEGTLEGVKSNLQSSANQAQQTYDVAAIRLQSFQMLQEMEDQLGGTANIAYRGGAVTNGGEAAQFWTQVNDWFNSSMEGTEETNRELLNTLVNLEGQLPGINLQEAIENGQYNSIINAIKDVSELNGTPISNEEALVNFVEQLSDLASSEDLLDQAIGTDAISLYNSVDAIEAFCSSVEDATTSINYLVGDFYGIEISERYADLLADAFDDEDLANQIATFAGLYLTQGANEAGNSLAELISQIDNSAITNLSSLRANYGEEYNGITSNQALAEEYARQVYGDQEYEVSNKGVITFNGVEQDTTIAEMAQYLADQAAITRLLTEFGIEGSETYMEDALVPFVQGLQEVGDAFGINLAGNIISAMENSILDTGTVTEGLDLSNLTASLSRAEYEAFTQGMSNMDIPEWADLLGLSSGEVQQLFYQLGFDSANDFEEAIVEAMGDWDYEAWMSSIYKSANNAQPLVQSVMEGVQGGTLTYKNITENDDYSEMMDYLKQLEKEYPELTDDVNTLNKTWLVGTQDYITALQKVQDQVNTITLESLKKEVDDAKKSLSDFEGIDVENGTIDISADPSGFLEAVDTLLNQEYAVDIELHTEAENEFNSVVTALDDIHDKAALIGEDFIVAGEDIRELNNTFPGILEGLEDLHDGTIRLNEESVQSAINAAELEAAADVDTAREKLVLAQDELRTKQIMYEQIADAAAIMAQAEVDSSIDSTDAQQLLTGYLTQYETEASAEAAENEIADTEEVALNADESANAVAEGYGEGYSSAIHSSAEFASAAVSNMQYVATMGEQGQIIDTKITVDYKGANYSRQTVDRTETTTADQAYESLQAAMNDVSGTSAETWSQIEAMYRNLAESAGKSVNDIDGMLWELGARASGLDDTFTNIRNGNGANGSSGSSGSTSTSEPNHEDYIEDEADRYHDINLELAAISEKLSRIQTQESKLVGQDLLDSLNDQLATLDDQIDATTRKLAIANDEAAEMRASLSAQGVTFDENGYITNYASIMQSQLDYVNSAIDRYNAMSAEEQDLYKDTLDAIKQDYSDFVQAISDYDDLISDFIPGLEDDIQSALDQEIEIQIQKFTAEVEIRLDMREAEQDWDEFYRKVILGLSDDDIMGNAVQNLADLVSYFNTLGSDITSATADNLSDWISQIEDAIASGGTGSIQALTDQVNATLDQLAQMDATGWASAYGDNRAQALEDLQTYYTELMSQLEDVQDLINDIEDSYLDMIDEAVDAFDEQVDQYEYINDLLNHDINLVSLLYGDDAYEQMSRYYEQIEKNNNEELDFLRQRVLYAQQMMEVETDDDARKKWEEEWENALSDLNDKVEDSVQNIIDKYVNAIEEVINALNDSVTNGLGLDYVGEEWDLMNQEADIYLDTINSLYAIQDLENKYLNAINDTDDIYAQQRLADIMAEQVAYLQDKEYLTQYDVDRAELQYEIALKQIALEEAQQNKNSMRLRRDSQGNYTYQYVSDENAVAEAQQELLDLQNQLYNFDKNAYKENLDDLYSLWEEYVQKLEELYEDQTLTDEERQERLYLLQQYYGDMINALVRENNYIRTNLTESATDELAALYGIDVQNFRDMTDEEIDALMTSLVPQWSSGVQEMADTFAGNGGFIPTCEEAFKDLEQATVDYEDSLDDLAAAAGIDFSDIANGYDSVIEEVSGLIEENDVLIDQYADQITAIQNVISLLDDLIAQYKQAQSAAEAATTAAYSYWQQTQASSADAFANDNGSSSSKSSSSSSSSSSGSSSGSSSSSSTGSGTQGNGSIDIGDKVKYEKGVYYYDSNGSNPSGSQHQGEYVYITNYKSGKTKPIHISTGSSLGSGDLGWLEKDQISGYDTGGYTGEWDNSSNGEGALAVLHQKELVLNQTDTDNLLVAVGLVRNMASMLSALDTSIFGQIASLASNLELGSSFEGSNNTIEQDVHIDATFPNVTNSHEIEDAFNNLVNIASQHAYNTIR